MRVVVEMLAEVTTISGLVVALLIFSILTIKSMRRNAAFGSLKFGISIATFVWIAGEAVSFLNGGGHGQEVHTVAMAIFAFVAVWRARIFLR